MVVGSDSQSVGQSVKKKLTSGASVGPENDTAYSAGNEGKKKVKQLWCGDTTLSAVDGIYVGMVCARHTLAATRKHTCTYVCICACTHTLF